MMNQKMMKTAKTIATVLKVLECVAVVGLIVMVMALLSVAVFGNAVLEAASDTLQLDFYGDGNVGFGFVSVYLQMHSSPSAAYGRGAPF